VSLLIATCLLPLAQKVFLFQVILEEARNSLDIIFAPAPKAIYVGSAPGAGIACKRLAVVYPAFSEGGRALRNNPLAVSAAVRLASYYLALFETVTGHKHLLNVKRLERCCPSKNCISVIAVVSDPWEMECRKRINLTLCPFAHALRVHA
jgi:hypothetical protein